MKTAKLLFGLVTAACSASQPEPAYPLCDREGAPACGNIGQVGRAEEPPRPIVKPAVQQVPPAARPEARPIVNAPRRADEPRPATNRVIPVGKVLVGAAAHESHATAFSRPLVDNREQIVCGNVMSKGGSRRVCRNTVTNQVTAVTELDGDE